MRTINVTLRQEKNRLDSDGVFLYLLQFKVPEVGWIYYVPNPEPITFDGITYTPFGLEVVSVSQDLKGGLEDIEVNVGNPTREVSSYVELHEMRGAPVKLLTVNSKYLADPTAIVEALEAEITEIRVKEAVVSFSLGHERLLQHRFPAQRYLRNNCRWIYKSPECGYGGALPSCDKVLEGANGCRAHSNQGRFGGFPGLPAGL